MKQKTVKYETGATSHAVNELILFTDNTRELAELRDKIYKEWADKKNHPLQQNFIPLLDAATLRYYKEFKMDPSIRKHIDNMSNSEGREFCQLYAKDFNNWKRYNGYK